MDPDLMLLTVDQTETIVATVQPTNATNKRVIWESSDPEVATVDASGKVTAVAGGTATITVTTRDGGYTATKQVIVGDLLVPAGGNIQEVIDEAQDGAVIAVAPSTYEEQLVIDKPLTLLGPNADISGTGVRNAEATITYPDDIDEIKNQSLVYVTADNVVVNGLSFFADEAEEGNVVREIHFAGYDNEFRNNRVTSYTDKIAVHFGIADSYKADGVRYFNEIRSNDGTIVKDNYIESTSSWSALYLQGRAGTVEGNTISGGLTSIQIQPYWNAGNGTVKNNVFYGYDRGIWHNRADIGSGSWLYEDNDVFAKFPTNPYRPDLRYWMGIAVQSHGTEGWGGSQPKGDGRLPELEFKNNTVDGANAFGNSEWDKVVGVYFISEISAEAEYVFDSNKFINVDIGVSKGPANLDLSNVLDLNTFPEGSMVIGDQIKVFVPEEGKVYNKNTGAEFDTIQEAVDEAAEGATILVGPGEYKELIKIGKSITLKGANAGVNPNTGDRGPESTITGENSTEPEGYHRGTGIQLLDSADNVVIDGFEFKDTKGARSWFSGNDQGAIHLASTDNGYAGGYTSVNHFSNITIRNNYFHDLSAHAVLKDVWATHEEFSIQDNLMQRIGGDEEEFSAIKIQGFGDRANEGKYAGVNGEITGNVIDTATYAGIIIDNVDNFLVDGNTIRNVPKTGINVDAKGVGNKDLTISNNTIENAADDGGKAVLRIKAGTYSGRVEISGNIITDSKVGMLFESGILPASSKTFAIEGNILDGNAIGLENNSSTLITATNNYWGHESGPYHSLSNPDGQGDSVSDGVVFFPWYVDEGMSEVSPYEKGIINARDLSSYKSIQAAINVALPGDTIFVSEGTYTGNLTVATENLTLKATDGAASTKIKGNITMTASSVTIEGFTVDGKLEGPAGFDPQAIFDNNIFPEGSRIIGNKIMIPADETVYNLRTGDDYTDIQDAVSAAEPGDTILVGPGVYEIVGATANNKDLTFVGNSSKPKVTFPQKGYQTYYGCDFTFENLTLECEPDENYRGIQPDKVIARNCVINGKFWGYAKDLEFTDCIFNQETSYNIWTYGSNVTFENCEFNSAGRSVLIYNEGATLEVPAEIVFKNCTFSASTPVDKKAAIDIDTRFGSFNIEIENCSASGFSEVTESGGETIIPGFIHLKATDKGTLTVTVDGMQVYQLVPVTEVSLDRTEIILVADEIETLTATVGPANATNKEVTWTSSDETVATVDENGKVTAVAQGTSTITVTTSDGSHTATTEVTVPAESTVAMIGTTQYDSLREAVDVANDSKAEVIMIADVTIAGGSGGYGVAGLVVNGAIIDGNGNTLTVTGANATWNCAIYTTGGTIKNLTIGGAFRGIFTAGCSEDIIIDNVMIDNTCYTFSSDGSNSDHSVIITNSTLNGWTSYTSGYKAVSFTNCTFGKGTGDYQYAYMRPYSDTAFSNCAFSEGYELDARQTDDITLYNCTVGGVKLTQDNLTTLMGANAEKAKVLIIEDDVNATHVGQGDRLFVPPLSDN